MQKDPLPREIKNLCMIYTYIHTDLYKYIKPGACETGQLLEWVIGSAPASSCPGSPTLCWGIPLSPVEGSSGAEKGSSRRAIPSSRFGSIQVFPAMGFPQAQRGPAAQCSLAQGLLLTAQSIFLGLLRVSQNRDVQNCKQIPCGRVAATLSIRLACCTAGCLGEARGSRPGEQVGVYSRLGSSSLSLQFPQQS